ncbi:TIM-barrel domain-containing protein [Streptomyces sp. NRRL WC-3742]|uniref:TIM-barrel domain-containing protein n=1 Tax=Streptomyces sp. NRRL WC-3742 TaxID=1463934 RepID=UPI0004CB76A5|nr:TIM-barrel domain-containing protein [Streptomyces sp. NRRL WC-3742]
MKRSIKPRVAWAAVLATIGLVVPVGSTGAAHAADPSGPVVDGNARFTVESPTLIRLEYAGDGAFQDRPTFNAVNRSMPATEFTTSVVDGYRIIRTSALTLRYRQGSGSFNAANLRLELGNGAPDVTPSFPSTCDFGTGCEAEGLTLHGDATISGKPDSTTKQVLNFSDGFTGNGYVGGFERQGASVKWEVANVPADGQYAVQIRYTNADLRFEEKDEIRVEKTSDRTVTLKVNGDETKVKLPPTSTWDSWKVSTTAVTLRAGTSKLSLSCGEDTCQSNIDSIAVTPLGASYPAPAKSNNLGGYRNSLDLLAGPAPVADGILSRDGWFVLDDTDTGLIKPDGTVDPRPGHGDQPYQDGYLFGYGTDYKQALKDFRHLTGPAPLLPRSAFGVWYSRWSEYSLDDYQKDLLPAFRKNKVPLDQLVTDTDWKSPSPWAGWEFNSKYFPDPKALFDWEKSEGLEPVLNVHAAIGTGDGGKYPADEQLEATLATAGGSLKDVTCGDGDETPCKVFNLRDARQEKAYFDLHRKIDDNYGHPLWWLDSSDGETGTPDVDVSPDTYNSSRYQAYGNALGQRAYTFARIGSTGSYYGEFAPGVSRGWAEHRYVMHQTMDIDPTWAMLAFEAKYTTVLGAGIGLPYVSHDIGGYGKNSANAEAGWDDPDLYARSVQLGAFQPIDRLHSDHGHRLPWEYRAISEAKYKKYESPAAADSAEKFLRLREELVPYTYTLAQQATTDGLPMARALYLNWPKLEESYTNPTEYTYGDDVLVAPVTTPGTGTVTTNVWFPPGSWTDYFTGRTYTGPGNHEVQTTLDTMPVFLRNGGILTMRTDDVDSANAKPLSQVTVHVATGGDGRFSLYEDDGKSQTTPANPAPSTTTRISYRDAGHTLTIDPAAGTFDGMVANRTWTVKFHHVTAEPTQVSVNGAAPSSTSYDADKQEYTVTTGSLPTSAGTTVSYG